MFYGLALLIYLSWHGGPQPLYRPCTISEALTFRIEAKCTTIAHFGPDHYSDWLLQGWTYDGSHPSPCSLTSPEGDALNSKCVLDWITSRYGKAYVIERPDLNWLWKIEISKPKSAKEAK